MLCASYFAFNLISASKLTQNLKDRLLSLHDYCFIQDLHNINWFGWTKNWTLLLVTKISPAGTTSSTFIFSFLNLICGIPYRDTPVRIAFEQSSSRNYFSFLFTTAVYVPILDKGDYHLITAEHVLRARLISLMN